MGDLAEDHRPSRVVSNSPWRAQAVIPPDTLAAFRPAARPARVAAALRPPDRHTNATGSLAVEPAQLLLQPSQRDVRRRGGGAGGDLRGIADVDQLQLAAGQRVGCLARRDRRQSPERAHYA